MKKKWQYVKFFTPGEAFIIGDVVVFVSGHAVVTPCNPFKPKKKAKPK